MKFFIYSRKSVYTGKGESIENQIEMCKQYIAAKFADTGDHELTVYEDEGFSAKNTDRPRFQQMLRDLRTVEPEYLVCYRLDRISRSVSDFSALIEDLNGLGISFVCIKEEFDTSKPMGKAMMYIASVFAQLERETIAERVRDNMLMLARTGRWLGGTPPTGYTSGKQQEIMIDGKVKTSCKLQDNPGELVAVDAIFAKFLELHSVSGVSKYLIRQKIRSRGGQYFSLPGIKEILQNPVYCMADKEALDYFTGRGADVCFGEKDCQDRFGLLAYNKRDYRKKHTPRQPMDKWIIAIGRHQGRLTGKRWAEVQKILEENIPSGKRPAKMHNGYALLSGLIFCETCGSRMFAKQRSGKGANPELYDYVCNSKLRGGAKLCGCQNLGGGQTDKMVCAYLLGHMKGREGIYPLLEKLKRDLGARGKKAPSAEIDARLKQCVNEMDGLVRALSKGNLSSAFLQRISARADELEQEISGLQKKRNQLCKEPETLAGEEPQTERLTAALSDLKSCFEQLSLHEKRTLIKILVQKMVWDGKNLHLFLYGVEQ